MPISSFGVSLAFLTQQRQQSHGRNILGLYLESFCRVGHCTLILISSFADLSYQPPHVRIPLLSSLLDQRVHELRLDLQKRGGIKKRRFDFWRPAGFL